MAIDSSLHKPRLALLTVLALAGFAGVLPMALGADKDSPPPDKNATADCCKPAGQASKDDDIKLAPFPADKTIRQSVQLGGRELKYDATVGSLPVLDEKGKTIASVMFIAYTVPGAGRPVTFALNGGPGASSVYLNLGAIGPKRVQFGAEGNSPSDPAIATDNRAPGSISRTWCSLIRWEPASAIRS